MSERVTPVPIPNTEVKPLSADDSRNAKVGRRQDNGLFLYLFFGSKFCHIDIKAVICYIPFCNTERLCEMGITKLQLSNGSIVELIMPKKKGQELTRTCFRGKHCHQAGNFFAWQNFLEFWNDPEVQELLTVELEKLVAKEQPEEDHRIELDFSRDIGWDQMVDQEDLSQDELDACERRDINSRASALFLPDHIMPAPATNVVTMVLNMKHDRHWIFYVCSMNPGVDCGEEPKGDMTKRQKLVWLHWSNPGEELESQSQAASTN